MKPTPPDPGVPLVLDGQPLHIDDLVGVARAGRQVRLGAKAREEMCRSYAWVREMAEGEKAIYGITTGFGSLARVPIAAGDRALLSLNLIRSHAAGVGKPFPEDVVRAMLLLRANALCQGASGCRPTLVERLGTLLGANVLPVVPSQGSCGSSGDLAPLAHLGLLLVGDPEGEATIDGRLVMAPEALAAAGLDALQVEAKDGLAITNGAQATTAIAALAVHDSFRMVHTAEVAAAMSIEAMRGASRAFHPAVHRLRPYVGARACAANLRVLMAGSELIDSVPGKVQDAYSLRCTPTVLGSVRDTLAHVASQVQVEINAVTDNPVILMDADPIEGGFATDPEDRAYSSGLFHGEPVGIAMDVLKIAVAEMASISERRLYRLTTGTLSQRLPAGLAGKDRPHLGLMLPQTTAAALVSENKALGWPASMDSIPTSEDQEDHVAMSTTAARRAAEVVANSRRVLAIELLGAAHALAHRLDEEPGLRLGDGTVRALAAVQDTLGGVDTGQPPATQIAALEGMIKSGSWLDGLPTLIGVGDAPGVAHG